MSLWLLLLIAAEVHLLTLYGFALKKPGALWVLVPLLAPWALGFLKRRGRLPGEGWAYRGAALVAFHGALLLVRRGVMRPFDLQDHFGSALLALVGVLGCWVVMARPEQDEGPGTALWVGGWLVLGGLDPLLPVLGMGVAALLMGFGRWPAAPSPVPSSRSLDAYVLFLVLGFVLPKPWWDFGLRGDWVLGFGAFSVGWALAHAAPMLRMVQRLPNAALLVAMGALAVLYAPHLVAPWGLLLGGLFGLAQARMKTPSLARSTAGLCLGLGLSFAIHANAWLPGLRHLIWLGN